VALTVLSYILGWGDLKVISTGFVAHVINFIVWVGYAVFCKIQLWTNLHSSHPDLAGARGKSPVSDYFCASVIHNLCVDLSLH